MQTRTHKGKLDKGSTAHELPVQDKSDEIKEVIVKPPSTTLTDLPKKLKSEEKPVDVVRSAASITPQPDIIAMNTPQYAVHKKGIVQFTHKKHVEVYLIACGSCHHDENGKPLELKKEDTPKGCIECHRGTQKPKGEKLGDKEKIAEYHFEALHANCIDCHKDHNKKNGDEKGKGPAPTSCTQCHPK